MYGYTMRIPQPIDVYAAMHQAVIDIAGDDVEGLILHFAHPTPQGFQLTEVWESRAQLDAFNREVLPRVMESSGVIAGELPTEVIEFDPVVVVTPHAYNSDRGSEAAGFRPDA